MLNAEDWVEKLELTKHPEGGYFREIYRSPEIIAADHLPTRFSGARCFSTAIYFMLAGKDFSAFHRIKQDEVWHFYTGSPVNLHVLTRKGSYYSVILGADITRGETFQAVVKAGDYFGAELQTGTATAYRKLPTSPEYALVGCTVAPGFDFADFDMPQRETLNKLFPQHQDIIARLTHS